MQIDLFSGRKDRDAGLARSGAKNALYRDQALEVLVKLKLDYLTITGEQLRYQVITRLGSRPTSPHFWGSLISTAVKRHILRDSGRIAQMKDRRSHARRTPLWEFV